MANTGISALFLSHFTPKWRKGEGKRGWNFPFIAYLVWFFVYNLAKFTIRFTTFHR
ncbi:hypothetical protein HMPREF0262_02082 [Clostridium sp. ATCC 29733]|nr:hypothetical protein HMPREF0262_02082 [Clostridium sp. ATCC 29733]